MKRSKHAQKALALVLAACLTVGAVSAETFASQTTEQQAAVTGMTTEYLTNPIGIDGDSVHFAWKMDSNRIGAKQTAYQIVVKDGENTVWDSGKVEDDISTGIVCGTELEESTQYDWTVTVWDEKGQSFAKSASFETGVTNQKAWQNAEFIRLSRSASAPIFRTEKSLLQEEVQKARLYITAMGAYEAYVNGNRVGEYNESGAIVYHHMNPGYGNRNVSLGYQTYDVTAFLADSETAAVSVLAGTGWNDGVTTGKIMNQTQSQPAVKALLQITYADGSVQNIQTNTTDWRGTLEGGITGNGIYYGEDYNAVFAEELGDFTQADYNDNEWVNASSSQESVTCISNTFEAEDVSYVRLLVKEVGPADNNTENLLQIMELELLDTEGNNVARGVTPEISNTWSPNGQWNSAHLTDGDKGDESDRGYTSEVLNRPGGDSFTLAEPISITLNFSEKVTLQKMNLYPRVCVESVSENQCANYPKTYELQVSEDGENWTTVALDGADGDYRVESLRNLKLHPISQSETSEFSIGNVFEQKITTQHVKISVSELGPAIYEDRNENRLQIMELELLDGETNVAKDIAPTVSDNSLSGIDQWKAGNLTDGDYGVSSDRGYSSDILGYGEQSLKLQQPISIQLDFDEAVSFSALKFYPRVKPDSISAGTCPNYPKVYSVEASDDGINWVTVLENHDLGMVRNETLYQNVQMSQTAYPGTIRAQNALPGKFVEAYDREPISAYTYTNVAPASDDYPAGEVILDDSYDASSGQTVFGDGIELKKGQTLIVNMGQNMSAVPNITFAGQRGTRAVLNFAEMLNDGSAAGSGATQADGPKGSIYQKSLRGARSAATYVFAGEGKETYQPKMSYFGYQYVQITASDDITVYALTSKALSSVTKQTGTITTNNETVNKLFSNVIHGQLSNYYTTPSDCNQRDERLSWSGDTQAFAQTAVYNFDSVAFLQEMQDIFNENTFRKGYVPGVSDELEGFFSPWAAGWSDVLIIVPWVMYQQTGDKTILAESWSALVHYMDYMKSRERGENQAPAEGNQNYGDWLSFQGTSIEVMNDYYYGYMYQLMAKIAGILGKEEEQEAYSQKFEAIKEKFIKTHVEFSNGNLTIKSKEGNVGLQFQSWTDKKGIWENNSQTSLLWMLKLGFYNSEEMREAAETLLIKNIKNEDQPADSVRARYGKNTLAVGFLGSNIITPVLTDIGYGDVSYDLLLQEGQPSWLFEVLAGATTVWERWNSYTPGVGFGDSEMNSFNHYAYGSVVEWMYRYMAGISADEQNPGFKNSILQPMPDLGEKYNDQERIHSVDSSYESYYGTIKASWKTEEQKMVSYKTEIPANTTADLYLPIAEEAVEDAELPNGVTYQDMELHNGLHCAKFKLESGGYAFQVNDDGKLEVSYAEGYHDGNGSQGGNQETEDQAAAKAVTDAITAIGTVTYDTDCKERIDQARKAYNNLSAEQKALIDAKTYEILTEAEKAYAALLDEAAAKAVTDAITAIGTVTYDADCKTRIDQAREAYDNLTDAQKELILAEIYDKLERAEAEYKRLEQEAGQTGQETEEQKNQAAAKAVTDAITAIGTVTYDAACKERIDWARKAYNNLSAEQKALVDAKTYEILEAAEKAYAALLDAHEKEELEKAEKEKAQQGTVAVEEIQKEITKANTDKGDVSGSTFAALKLKATASSKKALKLSWSKVKNADGYLIYGAACGKQMKLLKEVSAAKKSFTQSKLKKGAYYKYMVTAYQNIYGEKRVIATSVTVHASVKGGKFGNPSSISYSRKKVTLKKGRSFTLKPNMKSKTKVKTHIAKFRYESSNPKVALVNKKGKITAKQKGTCYIYLYTQNGIYKRVKVTVK